MSKRQPRAEAKALRSGLFKLRIVKPKKGKGAYNRRSKHPGKGPVSGGGFVLIPLLS